MTAEITPSTGYSKFDTPKWRIKVHKENMARLRLRERIVEYVLGVRGIMSDQSKIAAYNQIEGLADQLARLEDGA